MHPRNNPPNRFSTQIFKLPIKLLTTNDLNITYICNIKDYLNLLKPSSSQRFVLQAVSTLFKPPFLPEKHRNPQKKTLTSFFNQKWY